jgi:hypothetical protein
MSTHTEAQQTTLIAGGQAAGGTPADAATLTIRGIVEPDGTIYNGSGFSVSRSGTGSYVVTFASPFSDVPAISLTAGFSASPLYFNPLWVNTSTLSFTYLDAEGNPTDSWFFLIAIGAA